MFVARAEVGDVVEGIVDVHRFRGGVVILVGVVVGMQGVVADANGFRQRCARQGVEGVAAFLCQRLQVGLQERVVIAWVTQQGAVVGGNGLFVAHTVLVGFSAEVVLCQPLLVLGVVAKLAFDDAVEGGFRQDVATIEGMLLEEVLRDEAAQGAGFGLGFAQIRGLLLYFPIDVIVGVDRDAVAVDGSDGGALSARLVKEGNADKQHADAGDDDEGVGDAVGLFFADVFEHGVFRGLVWARIV